MSTSVARLYVNLNELYHYDLQKLFLFVYLGFSGKSLIMHIIWL